MSGYTFLDEGGFFCFCEAHDDGQGGWRASVRFERKSDHTAQKTKIPGMTHKITATFNSRDEAMSAACDYALDHAARGDTGL